MRIKSFQKNQELLAKFEDELRALKILYKEVQTSAGKFGLDYTHSAIYESLQASLVMMQKRALELKELIDATKELLVVSRKE